MTAKTGLMTFLLTLLFFSPYISNVKADTDTGPGPGMGMGPGPYGGGYGMMRHHGGQGMHYGRGMHDEDYGHGPHIFGTPWKDTLSKEQALQIDKLHLKLQKESSVVKAKIKVAKAEMAILLVEDKPNQSKIDKAVKEILELKSQKMKLHNAHVIAMRKVLTEEQRVSFDSMFLHKAKSKHKGH